MRTPLFSLLLFWVGLINSQVLFLTPSDRGEDAQFKKLIIIDPVFALNRDSVSNPLDVSSARASDPVFWRKVQLPETNPKFRVGFTWTYDGSNQNEFGTYQTLILIENPGWTHYPSRIWVDHNHNYDFTDDGNADTLTLEKGVVVQFPGYNGYQVMLEHFPVEKFNSVASMNDDAVRKLMGNRIFLGTAASLREQRRNVIAAHWKSATDSFTLGIKDANCNGKYNEDGDMVMLTSYKGVFENLLGVKLQKGKAYLEWGGAAYHILKADADGKLIEVLRDTASLLKYSLNAGEKLPRFRYCSATKPARHRRVRALKGKMTYIYVWRDGMEDFIKDSANWHALGRLNRDDFAVLGLNYGASARYVYQYNNYFETRIIQGYSSNELNRELKIHTVPYGILIDKKQRILATGIRPEEVFRWLK